MLPADAPPSRAKQEGVRYFVPGLPETAADEDLRQHFSKYGNILDAAVVKDKSTGMSRGFGYVEMADASGQEALLNDSHTLGGKAVSVMLTKDSLSSFNLHKVHLGKLPLDMGAEPIREAFSQFGVVLDVHLPKDPRTGERRNYGFVTFGTEEAFTLAVAMRHIMVGGVDVLISPAAQSRAEMQREAQLNGRAMGSGGHDSWSPYADGPCGRGPGGDTWGGPWQGPGCGWGAKGGPVDFDPWYGQGGGPMWDGKGGDGGRLWGCAGVSDAGGCPSGGSGSRRKQDGTRYFVPGLPESVTDDQLHAHFSQYGLILDVAVVKEKGTEKSRGFGYVTMADASTREAILGDRHEFEGKPVTVMLTKDSLTGVDVKKVHLSKLSADITIEDIREAFSRFGPILDVHTPKDPSTGERKNFGFVTFSAEGSFEQAIATRRVTIRGQEITIRPAAQCRDGMHGGACGGCGALPSGFGGKGAESWGCWGGPSAGKGCWGACGGGYGAPCWGESAAWDGSDYGWGSPGDGRCWGTGSQTGSCMAGDGMGSYGACGACSVCGGCAMWGAPGAHGDAQHGGKADGIKYFVAGLPEWVNDEILHQHFSMYGTVAAAAVVKEKRADKSRGFGYVTMADASSQEVILNTKHMFGETQIGVMLTKESLAGSDVKKVHLGKLDTGVSVEAIRETFSQFGVILDVHTPKDP